MTIGYSNQSAQSAQAPSDVHASVTVNLAERTGREVFPHLFGVAMPRSDRHVKEPEFMERIPKLEIPFLSLSLGDFGRGVPEMGPIDWTPIDGVLERLSEIHTGPILVALGGPNSTARGGWFDVGNKEHQQFWAELVTEMARRFAAAGVRADWWELWNEPDGHWGRADTASFEDLWELYNVTAKSLKAFDPTLLAGGPAIAWPYPELLRRYFQVCGDNIDFVSYHRYGSGRLDHPTQDFLVRIAPAFGADALRVEQQMKEELGGRRVPIMLTEYNMNYGWNPGEFRQQNEVNVVFTTVTLLEGSAGGLDAAAIWGAYGDSQFGMIRPDTGNIAPVGYQLRQMAKWVPGLSVKTEVSAMEGGSVTTEAIPLRAYATVSKDGTSCTVILANTSESTEVSAFIGLRMGARRQIVDCEQFEVGGNHLTGQFQKVALVPQMMEVSVPPMSVVMQRFVFNGDAR